MCAISLCASRIGLGWAHDVFTLHVACSRIIHAFARLFTYSYYCELCWSFSDCFFLSPLYLLVTLVVSMAPKHKSTSTRNPLHSGASTSPDHAPLSLRFHNNDAHKAFTEKFSRRGIHSECRVISGHFADTNLPTVIHSREWESLCDEPITCPSRADLGVLLQHAWDWPLCTSFCYSGPRYFYSYYIVAHFVGPFMH